MKRILEVDPVNRLAVVEPGVVNLDLSRAVADHGLYYAPDPSSQRACTIGGNVAENAGGPHCLAYGVTTNHVLGLEVVLAGRRDRLARRPTRGTFPATTSRGAFVGSEGTLAIVTKIVVRLLRMPESTRTLLAIFDTVDDASNAVSAIIAAGIVPSALEMMDRNIIARRRAGAARRLSARRRRGAADRGRRPATRHVAEQAAAVRDDLRRATARARCARPWTRRTASGCGPGARASISALGRLVPELLRARRRRAAHEAARGAAPDVYAIAERYGFAVANVFHAGDGNLHPNILFDERVPGATARVLEAGAEIMRLCVDAGGSITGEHGVGLEKRDFMAWIFDDGGPRRRWRRLKAAFRPDELYNPCKALPDRQGLRRSDAGAGPAHWRPPSETTSMSSAVVAPDVASFIASVRLHKPGIRIQTERLERYAVDHLRPSALVEPATIAELQAMLAEAHKHGVAVIPWGGGAHMAAGNTPSSYDIALSLARLDRIVAYEPADLTVTVEAGVRLATLQAELGEHGQFLPLDPPCGAAATIGGVLASNAHGPLRHALRHRARLAHRPARCAGRRRAQASPAAVS